MTPEEILRWAVFVWPLIGGAAGAWFGVKEALREARAANRRLDSEEERRALIEKDLAVTRNDLKHAQEEIGMLRKVRHDVIDTLNGVVQFLANVKENRAEADALRVRVRELEAGGR